MNATDLKPGKLVKVRGREWVVLPSADEDILRIKPLGGAAEETTDIFLPFGFDNEYIEEVYFPQPSFEDLGDIHSARLLYDAVRLSLRDAAGPFRSIAKYNFTPRAYQIVPLIMALKQEEIVRLFIADDVGIGKTIESLMIVRELLDRGMIKRFAVVCLPHLCDQWQQEIRDKFGLDAVIFRSSSAAKLSRQVPINEDPLQYYPYQVVSIDYIKHPKRSNQFVSNCPEMVVLDEAHTAATDHTASKQQRHELIRKIANRSDQHLILLSATPHSGKPEQFQSILGLLDTSFNSINMSSATKSQKEKLVKHYVQRRRADIIKWEGIKYKEATTFPKRENYEVPYQLSTRYLQLQQDIMGLAKNIATEQQSTGSKSHQKLRYWTALGLIRGAMSSPEMGIAMLEKRAKKIYDSDDEIILGRDPNIEDDFSVSDSGPTHLISEDTITDTHWRRLKHMSSILKDIKDNGEDQKIKTLAKLIKDWHKEGFAPIVYCRFIRTAEYVGSELRSILKKKAAVTVVTSQDPDDLRREKVESMKDRTDRVLVATDCMSEGINLQELFTAVIHYDLPWNPNRLEQREGRVDRFGQSAPVVKTALLYGEDNPMDGVVLKVLLQKAREIKKAIGISVPFPENNHSIMETVTKAILIKGQTSVQTSLFADADLVAAEQKVNTAYNKIKDIEKASRSMFAQHAIKAQDIEDDLLEALRLIGDMKDVATFVVAGLRYLGADIQPSPHVDNCYVLYRTGLPFGLSHLFGGEKLLISFDTPAPEGYQYIARNHPLVDDLCRILLARAMDRQKTSGGIARTSVVRTSTVTERTTVALMRVRNVIESMASKEQIVAEELLLWGYTGLPEEHQWLDEGQCMQLLQTTPDGNVASVEQRQYFDDAIEDIEDADGLLREMGRQQADQLVEAHDRFRAAVRGKQYQVVEPILPMDVMGVYIFLPNLSKR